MLTTMSDTILPQQKPHKLIVVVAFDRDEEGELLPVFGPQEFQSEDRAKRIARGLAEKHTGVVAWSRDAKPEIGEYGSPTVLFQAGDVPDME